MLFFVWSFLPPPPSSSLSFFDYFSTFELFHYMCAFWSDIFLCAIFCLMLLLFCSITKAFFSSSCVLCIFFFFSLCCVFLSASFSVTLLTFDSYPIFHSIVSAVLFTTSSTYKKKMFFFFWPQNATIVVCYVEMQPR